VQHLADRCRGDRDAETLELAGDPFVSPARILVSETKDQLAERALQRRSPGLLVRVCPPAGVELAFDAGAGRWLTRAQGRRPEPCAAPAAGARAVLVLGERVEGVAPRVHEDYAELGLSEGDGRARSRIAATEDAVRNPYTPSATVSVSARACGPFDASALVHDASSLSSLHLLSGLFYATNTEPDWAYVAHGSVRDSAKTQSLQGHGSPPSSTKAATRTKPSADSARS
jgi:hypothetical protein